MLPIKTSTGIFGKPKSLILKFMWNSKQLKMKQFNKYNKKNFR